MTKNLIVPVAGKSSRYPGMRPKWLLTMPDGKLMIEKSLSLLNLKVFSRIIVIVLSDHLKKYTSKNSLQASLKKNISKNVEIVELNKETTCQAETVLKGILKANIRGGIYIKDSDNIFEQKLSFLNKNQITTIDSKKVELLDAKNKSYISFDKMENVINIVEKKVISDFFCCGGYEFSDSIQFIKYAKECLKITNNVFISDVIFRMLSKGHRFSYKEAKNYIDWGTLREFRHYQRNFYTIFCDFDGCLVLNSSKFARKPWQIIPIKDNIKALKDIQSKKNINLIIVTSRPHSEKNKIKRFLNNNNISFNDVITNLSHSKRILVNDFSQTNPYPSSIAINIKRDANDMERILNSIIEN